MSYEEKIMSEVLNMMLTSRQTAFLLTRGEVWVNKTELFRDVVFWLPDCVESVDGMYMKDAFIRIIDIAEHDQASIWVEIPIKKDLIMGQYYKLP